MFETFRESAVRLNLGSGETPLDGYNNMDGKKGDVIYPLPHKDESVDEIRASHVLEHFAAADVRNVVADWVRVLKPGGVLKIAVPDFQWIAHNYLEGQPIPVQGYVMGGQVDERDFHKVVLDEESLEELMRSSGLRSIQKWKSEIQDCAALPVSLNLQGVKSTPMTVQEAMNMNVHGVMSVPRLGFQDNMFSVFESLPPLGVQLRKVSGAFWGQCLERGMEQVIELGAKYILTIDYDTVFNMQHAKELLQLMRDNPHIDALAPIQASRSKPTPLMTIKNPQTGETQWRVEMEQFQQDVLPISTAHFGLTILRAEKVAAMKKPWFHSKPDQDGTWGDDREDDDIWFWRRWEEAGNSLYLANHVVVGHAELMIRWPGKDMHSIYQLSSEYAASGAPEGVWK